MNEYKSVVQAVDVIRSFLNTHESNSTTCLWESNIDGTILKTDWGYFEEGLDEIRNYCERLDADRKDEPQKKEVEWVYNKRERLWYPYSNGELLFKDEPTTQTETQNSNLTFKTLEYCDICDHKGCKECIANALDEHCMPSQFKKQIEDECTKEYEELGLKELKELIEADRNTEPQKIGYCNECKWYGDKQVCGRCRSRNLYAPKTGPSNSEKPNNCEHITEDGVTCAKYPACDDCLDNPLNKVKGSERLVKGSEQTDWHYDEQDATWYPYKHEDEPQINEADEYWLSLLKDVVDGKLSDAGANQAWYEYINRKDEPQTDKHKCRRCLYYDISSDYYPCSECVDYSNYSGEIEDEPQTDCAWK